MKASLFLFLCLIIASTMAQVPKPNKPGNQTSTIEIKGSNNNVVKVIQAGVVVTYDLTKDQEAHKLLSYLRSVPSISKQLDLIEQGVKQIGQVEKNQNKMLIEIARNTAKDKEGFISIDTYNRGLEKYITENNSLKAEIAHLKARYQDTEFAAVLAKAEEKLRLLDNEGYQQLLEDFKRKRKRKVEQEKMEIAQAAYLLAQNSINQFHFERALEQIDEAIKYDSNNVEYLLYKGEILNDVYHIQEALDIFLKIKYDSVNDTLKQRVSNDIAIAYSIKEEYDMALKYLNKALDLHLKELEQSPKRVQYYNDLTLYYNNIGGIYGYKKEYDRALENLYKALGIQILLYQADSSGIVIDSSGIATCLYNIGNIYLSKKEYDKAIEYYTKALNIDLKVFGEEYSQIAEIYNNFGNIFTSKGEYTKAVKNYNKALSIQLKILGDQHPRVATLYANIGYVFSIIKEYDIALEYFNIALNIQLKFFNEDNTNIRSVKEIISQIKNRIP